MSPPIAISVPSMQLVHERGPENEVAVTVEVELIGPTLRVPVMRAFPSMEKFLSAPGVDVPIPNSPVENRLKFELPEEIPPLNVEVAVVEVAVTYPYVGELDAWIVKRWSGVESMIERVTRLFMLEGVNVWEEATSALIEEMPPEAPASTPQIIAPFTDSSTKAPLHDPR